MTSTALNCKSAPSKPRVVSAQAGSVKRLDHVWSGPDQGTKDIPTCATYLQESQELLSSRRRCEKRGSRGRCVREAMDKFFHPTGVKPSSKSVEKHEEIVPPQQSAGHVLNISGLESIENRQFVFDGHHLVGVFG